jgi:DNA-binding winged helix-turn-helix (wHTH) protein
VDFRGQSDFGVRGEKPSAGRLFPKQDLLDRVWSGVAGEEGSLTRGISSLRQILGSTADGQDYIQTVSKRGYRFISQVRETTDDERDGTPSGIPLPPSLLANTAVDFVGREAELVRMQDVWHRVNTGHHQLLLINLVHAWRRHDLGSGR